MTGLSEIRALDAADPLRGCRERFTIPDGRIYLDGNSLGVLPAATAQRMRRAVEVEWGEGLIGSWNSHGWIDAPRRVGASIAPLIGAGEDEVIVADSTSVNLFKLVAAILAGVPDRRVVLSEPGNFPTDVYIADGASRLMGGELRLVDADRIVEAIDDDTACIVLTHVHYKSGRMLDMAAITAAARARGVRVIWDLSHSAGAVAVDLRGSGAELAIGCGYKYLNGGPGAPAFLYVARELQGVLRSPLTGWMGHAAPFAFTDDYVPAAGMTRFLCGTPPILGLAALESGVAAFEGVDMRDVVAKSRALSELYIALVEERCGGHGLSLLSPTDPAARGSHVSHTHPQAYAICQALIARGVVGDFRAPDALRMGFTPLYTRFEDVWRAVDALRAILESREWERPEYQTRAAVT